MHLTTSYQLDLTRSKHIFEEMKMQQDRHRSQIQCNDLMVINRNTAIDLQ